ncbi:MAG: anti-sigma factor antagonist [Spartobacteria bacterium]|nr:anti-sigma factor antagonist [Spartobacteria bacterium]
MTDKPLIAPARLDAAHADTLERQFEEAIRAGHYHVVLSLSETAFISSAGIRVLLIGHRKLAKLGGGLRLVEARDTAREVLEMSGLTTLLTSAEATRADDRHGPPPGTRLIETKALRIELETLSANARSTPVFLSDGTPEEAAPLHGLPVTPTLCGVGLGAFGARDDTTAARIGEWMAVSGVAIALAPNTHAADYMVSTPTYHPETQVLHAACFSGPFSHAARFSPAQPDGDVALSDLLDAALDCSGAPRIGLVLAGETSGLIGATMTAAPGGQAWNEIFAYPGIRERLALTPEPEFVGELALVTGMVSRGAPPAPWPPLLRPMDSPRAIYAHLHAAVFSYAAIPAGRIELDPFVHQLVEHERIRALLHLLNDTRPDIGAGESRFRSGLLWTVALTDAHEEATP